MKKGYLLVLFCLASISGFGQTAVSYGFARLPGAFNSIADSAATDTISGMGMASADSATLNIPIGFTFNFCGTDYTTCAGNAKGVLSLAGNVASYHNDTNHIKGAGWLMPIWGRLSGAAGTAYYLTSGTPGSRVFTLEWSNWSAYENSSASLNFQVKLYEGTNIIQFIYGASSMAPTHSTIGIANSTTDLQTLWETTATTTSSHFHRYCTEPDSGTVLQWCPPLAAPTPITGVMAVCAGSFTALSDTTLGGAWSNGNTAVATILDSTGGGVGFVANAAMTAIEAGMDTITYTITNACAITSSASAVITVNAVPKVDTITGGGNYCSGTGGRHIGLNGSDTGISYQLYHGVTAIDTPVLGTGSAFDFGLDTAAGGYTAVATDTITGCVSNMYGSDTIVVNPLPVIHSVTGGGAYCAGDTTGLHIGLSGSDTGINYQLYNRTSTADTALAGTGSALDFGLYTVVDSYTVVATNVATGCMSLMADSAIVVMNPLPNLYNVTGTGSYCQTLAGLPVGLNGSDTDILYQLYYHDTTAIGAPLAGTDTALNFGLDTGMGGYTVIATNAHTGCKSQMADSAFITIILRVIPTVSITPSILDTICQGESITFSAASTHGGEPSYQWRVNDSLVSASGPSYTYVPSNGNVVSVRLISSEDCAIPDSVKDSITVVVHPHEMPTVTLSVSPSDTVCRGTGVTITATPGFGGNAPAYTWVKNAAVVSTTDSAYSYIPVDGDNIYCVMESNYFCLSATTAYSNVINMSVETPIVPAVSLIVRPGIDITTGQYDTIVAVVVNGGPSPSYQWYHNGVIVLDSTRSVYVGRFSDKDSISVIVTRGDACNLPNFSSVIIHAGKLDIKQAGTEGSDIQLIPNPNNGTFIIKGTLGTASGTDKEVSVEITDMLGQVVYKNKIMPVNGDINEQVQLNNTLANGIYLLNLRSEVGNSTIRFVIGQ